MRYINTVGYQPKDWQKKADLQLMQLKKCASSKDRKEYLDKPSSKIWNDHKKHFQRLSHDKCWFSEAYASVSDYAIEHFRPKKSIDLIKNKDSYQEARKKTDTEGYWWLSYELKNLRLAAYKPNQLKANYFPLEATSILCPPLCNLWIKEKNILLDPCVKSDTELLTFDGVRVLESNQDPNSIEHIRARISIKVYGLESFDRLKKARARVLQTATNYFDQASLNWDAMNDYRGLNQAAYDNAKDNFALSCGYLIAMLKPNQQFTRMILAFLKGKNLTWINDNVLIVAKDRKYI